PVCMRVFSFFFQAADGIRDFHVTGVQTCALPIWGGPAARAGWEGSGRGLSGRPGSDPPLLPGPGPLDSSPVLRGPERAPARGRVIGEVSTWRRVTRGRIEACRPDPT